MYKYLVSMINTKLVSKHGVTLIELILVMAILGLVITIAYSLQLFSIKTYASGDNLSTIQFDVRMIADFITKETRTASELEITNVVPNTVDESDKNNYIFTQAINNETYIVNRSSSGDRKLSLGNIGNTTFTSFAPNKILYFNISGNYKGKEYSLDSEVLILNIPEGDGITIQTGLAEGKAIRYKKGLADVLEHLTILTSVFPNAEIGQEYSQQFEVSGGNPPYTYTIEGELPPGIQLEEHNGQMYLQGTSNVECNYDFTIRVTDSSIQAKENTRSYSMAVIDPTKTANSVAAGLTYNPVIEVNQVLLQMPSVPPGFILSISYSGNENIVSLDGLIQPTDIQQTVDIKFRVTKLVDDTYAMTISYTLVVPPKNELYNAPPTASNLAIDVIDEADDSVAKVGYSLNALFNYIDNDPEGTHQINWYRSANTDGKYGHLIGNSLVYNLTNSDEGNYIYFEVIPVTSNGDKGIKKVSRVIGPILPANSPPTVKNMSITRDNNKLIGNYEFFDIDSDAEGSSVYKWYYTNNLNKKEELIESASTKEILIDKNGYYFFEVTPKAATGVTEGYPQVSSNYEVK